MIQKQHVRVVVVLEVMWGWRSGPRAVAPNFFRINPENHSGKRLYRLIGHDDFWVTNACREVVASASDKGTPDVERLKANLQRITYDVLLLCGKVAQETFARTRYHPRCKVVRIKHPAARTWTLEELERVKDLLSETR